LQEKLKKLNIGGIDPSFVCVGNWGHGYPRIGIVRSDNMIVAESLAGVRFLHLFSTDFPVFDGSVYSIKLQLVKPTKTGCFKIGDPALPFKVKGDKKRAVFLMWRKFSCCGF
jgi:hypothetical protein